MSRWHSESATKGRLVTWARFSLGARGCLFFDTLRCLFFATVCSFLARNEIYSKGTPIHIRGSLLFNHYIKEKKLTHKYSLINNGEKVKYIFLKKPNTIRENVISFISDFPKELGLDRYIDYELQFEKSFLDPLKSILDSIGWKTEHTTNLDSFFT